MRKPHRNKRLNRHLRKSEAGRRLANITIGQVYRTFIPDEAYESVPVPLNEAEFYGQRRYILGSPALISIKTHVNKGVQSA